MNWRLLVGATMLLGTGSACASDVQGARQMFRQMDRNGDRALQFAEIQMARAALFDRIDANRNGVLDPAEVQAAAERVREARDIQEQSQEGRESQAARMDRNSDRRISRNEFSQFIPDRMRLADVNGDHSLSLSELRMFKRQ
jgi:hypothetical protein